MALKVLRILALAVVALPAHVHAQTAQDIWLEHGFEPANPYVGQQVRYTLRLYQGVSLDDLRFAPPASALAEVRPLGEPGIDEREHNGLRYRVTEQHYALFPFASGPTPIRGGQALAKRAATASPELTLDAPAFTLDVRPAASTGAPWLPATALTLSESGSQSSSPPRAGDALQRTVRIEAHGLQAAQIPPLELSGTGFTAHRLPPKLIDRNGPDGIIGSREETWLIVPTAAGPLNLPPISVTWFDTTRRATTRSELPAYTLDVAPATLPANADAASHAAPSPAILAPPPSPAPLEPQASVSAVPTLAALAAVLLGVGLAPIAIRHHRNTAPLRALRNACRHNDARAAHAAALAWGRSLTREQPGNLPALARLCGDPRLAAALHELDHARFAASPLPWRGDTLCKLLGNVRRQAACKARL